MKNINQYIIIIIIIIIIIGELTFKELYAAKEKDK